MNEILQSADAEVYLKFFSYIVWLKFVLVFLSFDNKNDQ